MCVTHQCVYIALNSYRYGIGFGSIRFSFFFNRIYCVYTIFQRRFCGEWHAAQTDVAASEAENSQKPQSARRFVWSAYCRARGQTLQQQLSSTKQWLQNTYLSMTIICRFLQASCKNSKSNYTFNFTRDIELNIAPSTARVENGTNEIIEPWWMNTTILLHTSA